MALKLRDHYDWIVIGDDPGALLSAGLAAKLGLSVLVLPLEASLTPKVQGKVSVLDFESNFILGLGKSGLWNKCFEAIGMDAKEKEKILETQSTAQILTPDLRLTLRSDRTQLMAELVRELGPESTEMGFLQALELADDEITQFWWSHPERLTFKQNKTTESEKSAAKNPVRDPLHTLTLKKLPEHILKQSQKRRKLVHRWFSNRTPLTKNLIETDSEALEPLFSGIQASLTGSCGNSSIGTSFDLLQLVSLAKQGASYRGGMSAFRAALLKFATQAGADVSMNTVCQQIFIQNGRFIGVLPLGHGNMIGGTGAILGAPLIRARKNMTFSGGGRLFRRLKNPATPVGWKLSIALSIHVEALPPGISRRMLWQEAGAPPLEIEWVDPREYQQENPEQALFFIRTVLPYSAMSLNFREQRTMAARALKKVGQLCPFLEFHLRSIFPEFGPGLNSDVHNEGGANSTEKEFKAFYEFSSLEEIPSSLLCYGGKGLGSESGLEGLFLASKESYPDLGSLGPIRAALEGVAWIAHRSGLPGPVHLRPFFKYS